MKMDNKKQKVYRLTEAQFEKVIENTVKRANETKKSKVIKEDTQVIQEMIPGEAHSGEVIGGAVALTITFALKTVFSKYKELKAKYPQAPTSAVILNALSETAKSISGAK